MTAATREEISKWLDEMYSEPKYTHMIVVCDTFDYSDYPVYVSSDQDVREIHEKQGAGTFSQVMEVYSKELTKESQLNERRAFNF